MAKVLKVTKADKTIHIVPLVNRKILETQNNKLPGHLRNKIEEVEEADIKDINFIDENYTPVASKDMERLMKENEELKAQIAEKVKNKK
ncbi:MAG TPA: hypothetical protein P5509_09075 [Bacteroidales bacterium]|nr:hypothetical protein [Bacteroidales bacterium]